MKFHSLNCHPASPSVAGWTLSVGVERAAGGDLCLNYRLAGAAQALSLPAPAVPAACDGLWQHSCCEAFVAAVDGTHYREFNFSPSGCWAVYDFSGYRQRADDVCAAGVPRIECRIESADVLLAARVPAALLPEAAAMLGLSVICEALDGSKSYWALCHAAAQPDFHLAESFVLPLP